MKKEILKEIREPGKSRKKKGQPKGRRNGFLEGLTGKDFTAAGLFFFSLLLCRLFVLQYGVFGSSIDWISQHSTLADYFRKRFYATGNLFPDFAWNLGGGQNIYHFAYYGLLSPTVLLSYLFPFIPMDLWVMGSSALLYAADAVLFYRWISKKGLHYGNCLFTSLFFTCSTALLYHSYNQLMFVNYMPFLLLALRGVDRHFQKRKSGLLILSVLGMILTSFYFSVGGLLALTAYAVTEYLKCGTEMLRMKRNRRIEKCRGIKRPGQRKSRWQVKNLQEQLKLWRVCGAFWRSNPLCASGPRRNPSFRYSADPIGGRPVRQQRRVRTRHCGWRHCRTFYRSGDVETAVSDPASLLHAVWHWPLRICGGGAFGQSDRKEPVA